ncbi:uncharacterized protein [Nicotiana sylvestris]|uniref:uncharacterized protein n=1 Tax=Nicotiana sylvestris TaxID=4096 RepID=UPI00388CBB2F
MADVVMERRSSRAEKVHAGGELVRTTEGDVSSATEGDGIIPVGDDGSGSDIDPEEIRAFLERNTRVETLIMGIERERREERMMTLFKKLTSNEFQLFHDGLKQKDEELAKKDEELKERDEEIVRTISRCSELEAALKAKDDELEVSKWVMAKNADLQARVAFLTVELGQREANVVDLRDELSTKVEELARTEKHRVAIMAETTNLEDALCVCRSEWENEAETSTLVVARLEERIQNLEAKLSKLNKQIFKAELKGVRVKACAAREAYGYAPDMPGGDDIDDDADRLASDSWYDDEYADGDGAT